MVRSEESSAAHGAMGQTGEDFSKKASMSAMPVSCFSWQGNIWRWRCCAICAAMEYLFVFCVRVPHLGVREGGEGWKGRAAHVVGMRLKIVLTARLARRFHSRRSMYSCFCCLLCVTSWGLRTVSAQ